MPTYQQGENYIFYQEGAEGGWRDGIYWPFAEGGWLIGKKESLTSGSFVYKSKRFSPFINPIWTGFFLVSHGLGGPIRPPPLVSQPWGIWGIGANYEFCDNLTEDYFEVYNISVAQNLTILERIMRFCWKWQKIRTSLQNPFFTYRNV